MPDEWDEEAHLAGIPDFMQDPDRVVGPVCHNCFDGFHKYCLDINMPGLYSCDCRNDIHFA